MQLRLKSSFLSLSRIREKLQNRGIRISRIYLSRLSIFLPLSFPPWFCKERTFPSRLQSDKIESIPYTRHVPHAFNLFVICRGVRGGWRGTRQLASPLTRLTVNVCLYLSACIFIPRWDETIASLATMFEVTGFTNEDLSVEKIS